jgi:hypothetical protein
MNRRGALSSVALAIAGSELVLGSARSSAAQAIAGRPRELQPGRRPYIETGDGTLLFYQELGYRQMHFFSSTASA